MNYNSKVHNKTLGSTAKKIVGQSQKRKSLFIQNISNSETARIGNSLDLTYYMEIPPNSSLTIKIPEDNPREPLYARRGGSSNFNIIIWENYAK